MVGFWPGIFPLVVEAPDPVLAWWSRIRAASCRSTGCASRDRCVRAPNGSMRVDTCFSDVVRACANPARKSGWITGDFISALSRSGSDGRSVEVFDRRDARRRFMAFASTGCSRAIDVPRAARCIQVALVTLVN